MRITLLMLHSIEEAMQVQLLHELGHEVFSIGAYMHPSAPTDDKRPPLPQVPEIPDLIASVDALGAPGVDNMEAAKRHLPDEVLEWSDAIICHHREHGYIVPEWPRLKASGKRIIWRTVGQSTHGNEWQMAPLHREGLEIVRYSPRERNIPEFAGQDALIRFWMDPDEWSGWTGVPDVWATEPFVTNVTQDLYKRSLKDDLTIQPPGQQWTSFQFWEQATSGLNRVPAGPGSQTIAGVGPLPLPKMQSLLREARAYCFTGTQPASYTLGFIEALMTGTPLVSIGPEWMRIHPYSPSMFEAHEIAPLWSNRPSVAKEYLTRLLHEPEYAAQVSKEGRQTAIDVFGKATVAAQWADYLDGRPVRHTDKEMV